MSEKELKDIFNKLDVDKNLVVDKDELLTGMKNLGINFSASKVTEMFKIADRDHNGVIDFGEFSQFFNYLPRLMRSSQPESDSINQRLTTDPDAADGFYNTTGESIETLRDLFDDFDVDASATIELSELRAGFERMGFDITGASLDHLFTLADKDQNGCIDFAEFSTFFFHLPQEIRKTKTLAGTGIGGHTNSPTKDTKLQAVAELKNVFQSLKVAEDGTIDLATLKSGFSQLGLQIPEAKVDTMFALADKDADGRIDFDEFVAFFYRLPQLLRYAKFNTSHK